MEGPRRNLWPVGLAVALAALAAASLGTSAAGAWRAEPAVPAARSEVASAVWRGRIAVIGGYLESGRSSRRVDLYDPRRRRWSRLPDLPAGVNHAMAASDGTRLYVAGGTWATLAALRRARGGTGLAAARGLLVSVGGEAPGGTSAEVYALDPGGAWRRLADLPTPRHGLGVEAVGGRVYAIAGGPEPGLTVSGANESLALP